jgi:MFS family permease
VTEPRTRRLFLAVALLTLAVYLVSARGLPTTFDEQIMLDTTTSLVHGKANIDTPLLRIKEFSRLGVKRHDGTLAGIYGVGNSIASTPLYATGKLVAQLSPAAKRPRVITTTMMFTNALITAATVFILMLLCALLGASTSGSILVGLSFGLGSYAYPHVLTFFSEPGTALCVLAAVYFAIRASRTDRRFDLLASGAMAGAALLFRISAALFLPFIGVWLLVAAARARDGRTRDLRRIVRFGAWFTVGTLAPIALLLASNAWRYGGALNFGYALDQTHRPYPIVRGVIGQWFSSGKSLFLYAPIAVVAVLGLGRSVRKLPFEMCLLGAIVAANTLFFARVQFWSGDWAWGPRYMQIVLPCLAAMAAPLMDARFWKRALIVLSVLGFLFSALPAVATRFTTEFYAAYTAMPPPSVQGPPVWDHSYYALIWHTLHWQPILYHLRSLPHALSNTLNHVTNVHGPTPVTKAPGDPRLEFWWLRARDLGTQAVVVFALLPVAALAAAVRLLNRYLDARNGSTADL